MTAMAAIRALFGNELLLSSVVSWCVAQLLKLLIFVLTHKNKKVSEAIETVIWRTGGMPSSHSAVVCSLTTAVGFSEGISSNLFAFSVIFTMVVLRDALGVRRAAGLQAKALNNLGKMTAEKTGLEFHPVKEIKGHSPFEVVVGGFLGIFIAAGICLL